ncbi:MAG TPA: transposase [Terriglobia bacterium]|nr:transposase [Terriglobia bacterium]
MPRLVRYYGQNDIHFITTSTYHRARLFDAELFRSLFAQTLGQVRDSLGFRLLGYVVMPEHFHLLLWPAPEADPSRILQSLKVRTAMAILDTLRKSKAQPWCARMLERIALPATVHSPALHRVWQRRFYDTNIRSDAKVREKLNYMHGNPVKQRLVPSPEQWPWSSFRHYHLEDSSLLAMDRMP